MSATRIFLVLVFLTVHLCIIIWDVWVSAVGKEGETISFVMLEWSRLFPGLVLVIGFVLGHLFWPQYVRIE